MEEFKNLHKSSINIYFFIKNNMTQYDFFDKTNGEITEGVGYSVQTIQKALKQLVKYKLIDVEYHKRYLRRIKIIK